MNLSRAIHCRGYDVRLAELDRASRAVQVVLSQLTLADPRPFLLCAGFPVTERGDGSYDVKNALSGVCEDAVLEVYHRLYFWPNWPGPSCGPSESPQRLCGGFDRW
jgi:hypothetical protein